MDERQRHMIEGGLVRIPDAADFLGLSRSRLYQLIAERRIATVVIPGTSARRIPRRVLEEFAAAGLEEATGAAPLPGSPGGGAARAGRSRREREAVQAKLHAEGF